MTCYFVAGASGAAGAAGAAGAGAAGAAGVPSGAAGAAGAGAGVSALVSGFCSSAFLQPTTAKDKVTNKSRERIRENIFFIDVSPPFKKYPFG